MHKVKKEDTYTPENLILCLVLVNLEYVVVKIVDPCQEEQSVWDIRLHWDWEPQFQIFKLTFPALVNVDTPLEADFCE